jgi:acyl-CoA synthetase (NDP forming)
MHKTMRELFYPTGIAVFGVSEREENLGRSIVLNLLEFGYKGKIYPIGRSGGEVGGLSILTSIDDLPEGVELASILTPAPTIPDLLDACGQRGIRWACVQSGGFEEYAEGGRELSQRLMAVAEKWDIRFVGPNGLGVMCPESGVWLPFVYVRSALVRRGRVAVLAQSGGLSIAIALAIGDAGLGLSKGVSMGNKASLDEVDYLRYLLTDDETDIICLYLEGITNGRGLIEVAQEASKPILLLKSQVTSGSAQIAFSHVAAMSNDDRVVEGAARQANIVRSRNVHEMLDLAKAFSLPPVRGNRLLVLSRSAGQGVMATDAAEQTGFELPSLPDGLREKARELMPPGVIDPGNPIDLGTVFDFTAWARLVEDALQTLRPNAVILNHNYANETEIAATRKLFAALAKLARTHQVPIALVATTISSELRWLQKNLNYPIFTEVDEAVRALAAARDWHLRRLPSRLPEKPVSVGREAVGRLLAGHQEGPLLASEALEITQAYNIRTPISAFAVGPEEAVWAAEDIGYPVALKALSRKVSHKTDLGGVILNLPDADSVQRAYRQLQTRFLDLEMEGAMVQAMLLGGHEMIVGGRQDPAFGPVVMLGLGGIYAEVFQDVTFRVAPITHQDAEAMLNELKSRRLLEGVRGSPPADIEALMDTLVAVSRLLVDFPQIAELDINPLMVTERWAFALDARILLHCE